MSPPFRRDKGMIFNLGILSVGQVVAQLANIAALVFLASYLGAHWFGVVQIGVAFMSYALITAEWGLASLGVREVAVLDSPGAVHHYANRQTGLLLLQAVVVLVLGVLLLPHLPFYAEDHTVFLLYLATVLPQVFLQAWIAIGLEKMAWVARSKAANSLFYSAFIILLLPPLASGTGIPAWRLVPVLLIASMILGNFFVVVPLSRWLGALVLPQLPDWAEMRRRYRATASIGANALVLRVILNIDLMMIGILATPTVAGTYAAASRILFFLVVAVDVLWTALLPRLSRLATIDFPEFRHKFNAYLGVMIALLAPIACGGYLLNGPIIAFLYRGQFQGAAEPFRLLAVAYPCLGLSSFLGNALLAMGKQHRYTVPLMVAAGSALGGCILLVPHHGAAGAASAMLTAHALLLVLVGFNVRRLFARQLGLFTGSLLPILALMVLMIIVTGDLHVLLRILLAGGCYLGIAAYPTWRFLRRAPGVGV